MSTIIVELTDGGEGKFSTGDILTIFPGGFGGASGALVACCGYEHVRNPNGEGFRTLPTGKSKWFPVLKGRAIDYDVSKPTVRADDMKRYRAAKETGDEVIPVLIVQWDGGDYDLSPYGVEIDVSPCEALISVAPTLVNASDRKVADAITSQFKMLASIGQETKADAKAVAVMFRRMWLGGKVTKDRDMWSTWAGEQHSLIAAAMLSSEGLDHKQVVSNVA
jgi:hypothetical protein